MDKTSLYIVAEAGINHNGDMEKAFLLIDQAKKNGADAIKFQTHIPDMEMLNTPIKPGNSDRPLWDIISDATLTFEQEKEIKGYCDEVGITFFSTPFSREGADRLNELDIPFFKIGSGECNSYPLIEHISKFGKPMILSTGMNDIESIKKSVEIILSSGCDLTILHCVSMYPTPPDKMDLGVITQYKSIFPGINIGLSDHSLGIHMALGAIALGANLIEKHFTISKDWEGPDNIISLEPNELMQLSVLGRELFSGRSGEKRIHPEEQVVIDFAYASVVSIKDIDPGETFSLENIWVKRPGTGELLTKDFENLLGKKSNTYIPKDTQLRKDQIA
jgi:N-acetylneuraminate synthase